MAGDEIPCIGYLVCFGKYGYRVARFQVVRIGSCLYELTLLTLAFIPEQEKIA